jgi:type I restriction enzyme, S subunit
VNNQDSPTAGELESRGFLLVQDGNHGEYRPRPNEFVPSGVSFIRAADMSDGIIHFDTAERINETAFQRIRKGIGKPGDVIFSSKGTVGKIAQAPPDCPAFVCSPQTTFWRSLDESVLRQRYLFYFLSSPSFIEQWESRKGETDMADYVSLTAQRELKVFVSSIAIQDSIVSALSPLDERIQLNLNMNHLLEVTASALFRSWFVDFDPVTAKAESRTPFGMTSAIAAQFPSHFENGIPAGWNLSRLDKCFDIVMGQSPPGNSYNDHGAGMPFFQGRTDYGFRFPEKRMYTTLPSRIAQPKDVLVSVRAPVGDINVALETCCIGRGLSAVRSKTGNQSFALYLMKTLGAEFETFEGDGTVFGAITGAGFRGLTFAEPPGPLVDVFEQIAARFDERIELNDRQNNALRKLRDSLLPPLISGELRLADAEQQVESALS